jgi:hypothetical protein
MFFIYNPRLVSQAGRRGFEPRLPLHIINHLEELMLSRFSERIKGLPQVIENETENAKPTMLGSKLNTPALKEPAPKIRSL